MKVAVIIPTPDKNRALTQNCLKAVKATTGHLDVEVVVVESSGPGFRFSRSINKGFNANPDVDAWVMLNDDCQMQSGWLDAMLGEVKPGVGLVGALLTYPDGRVQHAGGFITGRLGYFLHCAFVDRAPFFAVRKLLRTPKTAAPFCYHHRKPGRRLDFLTGACLLVTRQMMVRVGPMDEGYEFGFEDVDYSLRAREAGLRIVLATGARGVHLERATGKHLRSEMQRSENVFNSKWSAAAIRGLS